ncbi:hypothetical protein AMJ40_02830 [candidate division TA06 bacterium DG_26]|uniref:DNA-binding protein n=1 Tax=candidate division TA06 bacterium DG_26 TaxID=1703771 RepID=A0A0S7WJY7_UNCT6|nr:MAG: hypothetical protein AMJ40_02830 [candidate division TA06 bacterium DG_26]
MNKFDLAKRIADETGFTQREALVVINHFLGEVKDVLSRNERVELRGFGVFMTKHRKGRTARNPRTGEPVRVPPRLMPVFKPSRELKAMVAK